MKLRTKLTVFSILLMIVAVAVCCMIILTFVQNRDMQQVIDTGMDEYLRFYHSFLQTNPFETQKNDTVKRSYLVSAFRSIEGFQEFTLRQGDAYLCNNVGFDVDGLFENAVSETAGGDVPIQYRTVRVAGEDYLTAHAVLAAYEESYAISFARNISEVTDGIRTLAGKCLTVGLTVASFSVVAMWWIVYRSMKPIEELKAGATELAHGNYEKRIGLRGKDELAELAADFNSMADAIERNIAMLHEKSERQQAFINDLSHELKTPVTSILLCSETLLNRTLAPEARNRSLERIHDQGKWLETLSQKLMALVMLQGEIALQPDRVARLLSAVAETTADALHEQDMELSVECGMDSLPMDFDLMRSALVNLVVNAARASDAGQTVEIRAHDGAIEVTDHGRGIPAEEVARVTEPFYMVDRSRNKKQGGAGLGLALVGRIVEAHGAKLEIESAVGEGTTVRIRFAQPKELQFDNHLATTLPGMDETMPLSKERGTTQ